MSIRFSPAIQDLSEEDYKKCVQISKELLYKWYGDGLVDDEEGPYSEEEQIEAMNEAEQLIFEMRFEKQEEYDYETDEV